MAGGGGWGPGALEPGPAGSGDRGAGPGPGLDPEVDGESVSGQSPGALVSTLRVARDAEPGECAVRGGAGGVWEVLGWA